MAAPTLLETAASDFEAIAADVTECPETATLERRVSSGTQTDTVTVVVTGTERFQDESPAGRYSDRLVFWMAHSELTGQERLVRSGDTFTRNPGASDSEDWRVEEAELQPGDVWRCLCTRNRRLVPRS